MYLRNIGIMNCGSAYWRSTS